MNVILVSLCVLCGILAADPAAAVPGDLSDRLRALEEERRQLEKEIEVYRQRTHHLLEVFKDVLQDDQHNAPDSIITKRQTACHTAGSQIAFHARLSNTLDFASTGERIRFDLVHTNSGGGYNSTTGVFTAPRPGNYQLMATAMSSDGNSTDIQIKRSLTYPYVVCRTHAGSSHQSMGLCSAFVALKENEQVAVEHFLRTGQVLAGGKFASFSGHLIQT